MFTQRETNGFMDDATEAISRHSVTFSSVSDRILKLARTVILEQWVITHIGVKMSFCFGLGRYFGDARVSVMESASRVRIPAYFVPFTFVKVLLG